jgi:hypothetical protein
MPTTLCSFKVNAVDTNNVYGNILEWLWKNEIVRIKLSDMPESVLPYLVGCSVKRENLIVAIDADLMASRIEDLNLHVWDMLEAPDFDAFENTD